MRKILSLITILPMLASCTNGIISTKSYYLDRSLDVPLKVEGYSDGAYIKTADQIISLLSAGQDVLLCTSSTTCSHCLEAEPGFSNFVSDNKIAYALLERTPDNTALYKSELERLNAYYELHDGDTNFIDGKTPALYLLNPSSSYYFSRGISAEKVLDSNLRKEAVYTNIYRTRQYPNLGKIESDTLVFLFDSSNSTASDFYANSFKNAAKESKNKSVVVDFNFMSNEDKEATLSRYSLSEYAPVLIQGETITKIENASESEALINSYF
ncbi:MAG: hypothetical protein MJ220_00800 [Bacilli bacterium]|nr:hypothetical protein [Bacilli bacterium]